MKVAVYSPYLDTAGGGEKYMLTIAQICSEFAKVDILLNRHLSKVGVVNISQRNRNMHNIDFTKLNFIEAPLSPGDSFLRRLSFLRQYDVLFYNSDGSLFFSSANKSIVHFQMPLPAVQSEGLWNRIKLRTWKKVMFNSNFTKSYLEGRLRISSEVVYPPVNTSRFQSSKKNKQILSVGRFMGEGIKKQEVMVRTFVKMYKKDAVRGWSLHLAGGVGPGDEKYFQRLNNLGKGRPIYFYPNISFSKLTRLYEQSSIYWHAMGFHESSPQLMEHFGISTVEAMAAGCIPVVIGKGGQKEIVENQKSGLLWDSLEQLEELTIELIKDVRLREKIAREAKKKSEQFSELNFKNAVINIVHE